MRNVVFALFVLALGTPTATAQSWADDMMGQVVKEDNGTTVIDPVTKKPKVKRELSHDFGNVAHGTMLLHRFYITNFYQVPLNISTSVGCHCVSVTSSTPVLPAAVKGQNQLPEAYFDITMDARRFVGPKKVNIYVTVANAQFASTATLEVTANSRADVVLNPGQVTFGVVASGQASPPQVIDVEYAGTLDWRVTELVKHDAPVDVTFRELYRRAGQVGYRVTVAVKPNAGAGALKHELYLKTNDPASPLVPILVEANIQASLTVAPNPVPIGSLKVGETVTKLVVVRGPKPFQVTGVEGAVDGLTAELPTTASAVQVVRIKYQPSKAGTLHGQLRLKTDLSTGTILTVDVEGNVDP